MIEVVADERTFRRVADALAKEANGDEMRRDLAADIYEALQPAVDDVRSALFARGGSAGIPHGEPLLPAIARGVSADVRVTGKAAGARIRAQQVALRGFVNAPKRFNERKFRRRVYGRDVWVTQVGAPGWFDETLAVGREKYRRAVERALEKRIRRIAKG